MVNWLMKYWWDILCVLALFAILGFTAHTLKQQQTVLRLDSIPIDAPAPAEQ